MSDYIPLSQRLINLTTRIDSNAYNEIQGSLYNNCCKKLEDIPAKACRLITRCDVPEAEICKVSQNFKTVVPPSHPRNEFPLYVMADLLPCYLPGRTLCPEFELWDCYQGQCFPTDKVTKKDKADLGFGELWVQTEYKVWQSCCNECDKQYNYDYLRLQPSVAVWFNPKDEPILGSDSFSESFDLVHEKIHVTLKNKSSLNLRDKELHVVPEINIISECSDSQSLSYSLSASSSILGQKVKVGISNKIKIDWCADIVELTPDIHVDISESDIVGLTNSAASSISLCDPNETFLNGSVAITPTLRSNGKISNALNLSLSFGNDGYGGADGAIVSVLSSASVVDKILTIKSKQLVFKNGVLCGVFPGNELTVDFNCDCGGGGGGGSCDCHIDCDYIRNVCGCGCISDSGSSSSSSRSYSKDSDSSSSSTDSGIIEDCAEGCLRVLIHILQDEDPLYPDSQPHIDTYVEGYTSSTSYAVGEEVSADYWYGNAATYTIDKILGVKCFDDYPESERTTAYYEFWNNVPSQQKFWKKY